MQQICPYNPEWNGPPGVALGYLAITKVCLGQALMLECLDYQHHIHKAGRDNHIIL